MSSPEAVSLFAEAKTLLHTLFAGLVISLPPDIAFEFGRRALSQGTAQGEPQLATLVSLARICDLLGKDLPQEALPSIREARDNNRRTAILYVEGTLHYLEALCRGRLDQPLEEFSAYQQWRNCIGSIGEAAVGAKAAGEPIREGMLLAGASRLHDLALAAGDRAIVSALIDDIRRFGYNDLPFTRAGSGLPTAPGSGGGWELLTFAVTFNKPVRKALTELISNRKEKLAFVVVEASYSGIQSPFFRKTATEGNLPAKFARALETELDAAKDSVTLVTLLPGRDVRNNSWVICQRNSERVSLAVRITDLGEQFRAQAVPVLAVPEGLPDDAWLRHAEDDIASLSHRTNLWQGDIDTSIERAARSMSPSLAPLEINRGTIRELT